MKIKARLLIVSILLLVLAGCTRKENKEDIIKSAIKFEEGIEYVTSKEKIEVSFGGKAVEAGGVETLKVSTECDSKDVRKSGERGRYSDYKMTFSADDQKEEYNYNVLYKENGDEFYIDDDGEVEILELKELEGYIDLNSRVKFLEKLSEFELSEETKTVNGREVYVFTGKTPYKDTTAIVTREVSLGFVEAVFELDELDEKTVEDIKTEVLIDKETRAIVEITFDDKEAFKKLEDEKGIKVKKYKLSVSVDVDKINESLELKIDESEEKKPENKEPEVTLSDEEYLITNYNENCIASVKVPEGFELVYASRTGVTIDDEKWNEIEYQIDSGDLSKSMREDAAHAYEYREERGYEGLKISEEQTIKVGKKEVSYIALEYKDSGRTYGRIYMWMLDQGRGCSAKATYSIKDGEKAIDQKQIITNAMSAISVKEDADIEAYFAQNRVLEPGRVDAEVKIPEGYNFYTYSTYDLTVENDHGQAYEFSVEPTTTEEAHIKSITDHNQYLIEEYEVVTNSEVNTLDVDGITAKYQEISYKTGYNDESVKRVEMWFIKDEVLYTASYHYYDFADGEVSSTTEDIVKAGILAYQLK